MNRTFIYFTWAVMFFVFGYLFSNFWTQLFGCSPPAKYWNPDVPGHCVDFEVAGVVYGSMNIASDFFIMILPLPIIWNLHLSRREKVGVSLVLLSGVMYVGHSPPPGFRAQIYSFWGTLNFRLSACVVAIIRMTYFFSRTKFVGYFLGH